VLALHRLPHSGRSFARASCGNEDKDLRPAGSFRTSPSFTLAGRLAGEQMIMTCDSQNLGDGAHDLAADVEDLLSEPHELADEASCRGSRARLGARSAEHRGGPPHQDVGVSSAGSRGGQITISSYIGKGTVTLSKCRCERRAPMHDS
jgi:hypothetical protein